MNITEHIVVDWGTSTFRAWWRAVDGRIKAYRETDSGIRSIGDGNFEAILVQHIGDWLAANPAIEVIALGMITSRNGWIEVPYAACPATPEALYAGMLSRNLNTGHRIRFIPGLTDTSAQPWPDVMRGEETQLFGLVVDRPVTAVLPGTHSKWAQLDASGIKRFRTCATGEVYALFMQHAFISRATAKPAADTAAVLPDETADSSAFDTAAFELGVEVACAVPSLQTPGGLLARVFTARTGLIAGGLSETSLPDYLSGLLIGAEFNDALAAGWHAPGDDVFIVGGPLLGQRYAHCGRKFSLQPIVVDADVCLNGVDRIVAAAGATSESGTTVHGV